MRPPAFRLALCSFAAACLLGAATAGAQPLSEYRSALLIANGDYRNFPDLANPVPEARALMQVLKGLGFEVRLVENASLESMGDALKEFEVALRQKRGLAFFHYGGHAVQVAGKNYLIPATADIPDEGRVPYRALDVEEIMAAFTSAGNDTSIVVLDACRNNPLPASTGRSATRGLQVLGAKPKNSVIVYAAEANTEAIDGLFTPILTREIQKQGLSFSEVLQNVRREVYEKSQYRQTPGEYNQLFSSIFLAGAGPIKPPPPPPPPSRGTLSVQAATSGRLYVDGVDKGGVSAGAEKRVDEVEAGSRSVELRYPQGNSESQRATVTGGSVSSVSFQWKPSTGLSFAVSTTPPGARITVNGTDRGASPLTVSDVEPGWISIGISATGYEDELRLEFVERGKDYSFAYPLKAKTGSTSGPSVLSPQSVPPIVVNPPTAAAVLTASASFGGLGFTWLNKGGGTANHVWTAGEYWEQSSIRGGFGSANSLALNLSFDKNTLDDAIEFDVAVNGKIVGRFAVRPAASSASQRFSFDPVSGPSYTVRISVRSSVAPGGGAISLKADGSSSSILLGGLGRP